MAYFDLMGGYALLATVFIGGSLAGSIKAGQLFVSSNS